MGENIAIFFSKSTTIQYKKAAGLFSPTAYSAAPFEQQKFSF